MANDNNIIEFPNIKIDTPPQSMEEVQEHLRMYKESYASDVADILWQHVINELGRAGCDFEKDMDSYYPSMVLILESIRSLHLQTSGIEHPLQTFAIEHITIEEIDEKMVDFDDEID